MGHVPVPPPPPPRPAPVPIGSWTFTATADNLGEALHELKYQLDEFFATHDWRTPDGERAYTCIPMGPTVAHDGVIWFRYDVGVLVIGPNRETATARHPYTGKTERLDRS